MATAESCINRESDSIVAGKAAHEVIRKFSVRLCELFITNEVAIRLYADDLLDHGTFEKYVSPTIALSTTDKGNLILLDVQRAVSCQADGVDRLCSILEESGCKSGLDTAKEIKGNNIYYPTYLTT